MSESYKTHCDGLYFVTFAVVCWADVFVRVEYQNILIESIEFCRKHKGLKIYCYCIMPSHIHFITYSEGGELSNVLRDLKSYTAKVLMKSIQDNPQESRKEWLLNMFRYQGSISPHKQDQQFWQHSNHPFYLFSPSLIQQKIDYIHYNPVNAGLVIAPSDWRLSSANENSPIKVDER